HRGRLCRCEQGDQPEAGRGAEARTRSGQAGAPGEEMTAYRTSRALLLASAFCLLPFVLVVNAQQRGAGGGRGQAPAPPATPKAAAVFDPTGYWVPLITEDWRFRMVTPPKGDYASVPLSPEGRRVADTWDLAKDDAAGN